MKWCRRIRRLRNPQAMGSIDRRNFLGCMAWAGTGLLWSMLDEIRRRKVRRRQLIASRLGFRHEGRKDRGRSVVASQCQDCSGNVLTLFDAVGFVTSIGNLCQVLLKL